MLTVITYGVPVTPPRAARPQEDSNPGPPGRRPGQHNQREATGDGEVQTPSRSVRESRPLTDCRLSAKTTDASPGQAAQFMPPAPSVLPRASSCGPAQRHSEPRCLRRTAARSPREGSTEPRRAHCTAAPQACELTTGRAHSLCRTETQRRGLRFKSPVRGVTPGAEPQAQQKGSQTGSDREADRHPQRQITIHNDTEVETEGKRDAQRDRDGE